MAPRFVYRPIHYRQTDEKFSERLATDPQFVARWARRAAVNGDAQAQLAWGQMLLNGYGTERDLESAFRWFTTAARSGLDDAVNMVGRCYERGWGVPVDAAAAVAWFRRAAANAHPWAQYNLACQYLHGTGVAQNHAEALALFVRAARRGNEKAMNKLGRYREEGWHGRVKLSSARRWYERAAMRGCFRGQFHLARFCLDAGDIDGAVRWFSASSTSSPLTFCRELGEMLAPHPDARIASIGREALARADNRVPVSAQVAAATALAARPG